MTEKQKEFIKEICIILDYNFNDIKDMNVREASDFIKENLFEYNEAIKELSR